MRVRLRTTLAGPDLAAGAGDTVTVPPSLGATLVEAGYAVPDTPAQLERSIAPPPETAAAGPQRRRSR